MAGDSACLAREEHLLRVDHRRAEGGDLVELAKVVQELEEGAAPVEGVGAVGNDDTLRHCEIEEHTCPRVS